MVIVSLQTASLPLPPPFSAERLWQSSQEKKALRKTIISVLIMPDIQPLEGQTPQMPS